MRKHRAATRLQRAWRRYLAMAYLRAALSAVIRLQAAIRAWRVFGMAAAAFDARDLLIGLLPDSAARQMQAVRCSGQSPRSPANSPARVVGALLTPLLAHSLTYSLARSPTHSLTHARTHARTHSLTRSLTRSLARSLA